jgi:hypothetical protein
MSEYLQVLQSQIAAHAPVMYWAVAFLSAISVTSVGGLGMMLVRLPSDYFSGTTDRHRENKTPDSLAARIIKNCIGGVLIIVGSLMALPGVPGPGVLTLLLGVMLTDFRKKRHFELWLIGRPGVLVSINFVRSSFSKPPLTRNESVSPSLPVSSPHRLSRTNLA